MWLSFMQSGTFLTLSNEACHMWKSEEKSVCLSTPSGRISIFFPRKVSWRPHEKPRWKRPQRFHLRKQKVESVFLLSGGFMSNTGRTQVERLIWLKGRLLDVSFRLQDVESSPQVLKLLVLVQPWHQRQSPECFPPRLSSSLWQGGHAAAGHWTHHLKERSF